MNISERTVCVPAWLVPTDTVFESPILIYLARGTGTLVYSLQYYVRGSNDPNHYILKA